MPRFLPLLCLALFAPAAHAQTYSVVDLGTLGGTASQAHGINAAGWVVGESVDANGQDHAFVYHDGHMIDLDLAGSLSAARAVNDAGQVGGYYYGKGYQAYLATDQKDSDLGTLGTAYSMTYAINAHGHAAGSSYTTDAREHAFLWDGHAMADLGTLGGSYSKAFGVNATDLVVGYAYLPNGVFHAFSGRTTGLTDLGTLGGIYSSANAVNDAGQIAGYAYIQGNAKQHACLWLAGVAHDLGDLGGNFSDALALDGDATHVVGRATIPTKSGYLAYHAFLWSAGEMKDLNTLLPAGSGWVLEEATGVNDAGQIVGAGTHNGHTRAFLLQPNASAQAPSQLPAALALSGAAPNPARVSAHLSYALPRAGQVSLRVMDVSGRLVRDLAHGWQPAGVHELNWNLVDDGGRGVGSGVYYARLELDRETKTTTVQVLR
jgi:probable HAF family extracellular repeat protein